MHPEVVSGTQHDVETWDFHQEKETASFGWVLLGNQTLLV
jgi:hypothetical protein